MNNKFDHATRSANGPIAFVSEYAVSGSDAGYGNLKAAIGEAAFLIGLELNSDIVEMASYAPLFVNSNDRSMVLLVIGCNTSSKNQMVQPFLSQVFKLIPLLLWLPLLLLGRAQRVTIII